MNTTTRRFARSLSEAFADERASWSEGWQRQRVETAIDAACAVLLGIAIGALILYAAI